MVCERCGFGCRLASAWPPSISWSMWEGEVSHLMAGHPAYEGGWGRPRQAHYLLQLVYIYSF